MNRDITTGTKTGSKEVKFLKQVPIFSDLSDEQIAKLLTVVSQTKFKEGETIIREGEIGNTMYILLDGRVEVSKSLTLKVSRQEFEEREKSFIRLEGKDHACFGEMAMLDSDERSATVVALTECTVFVIERDNLDRLLKEDSNMGYLIYKEFAQLISGRLRAANRDVLKLTTALSLSLTGR